MAAKRDDERRSAHYADAEVSAGTGGETHQTARATSRC